LFFLRWRAAWWWASRKYIKLAKNNKYFRFSENSLHLRWRAAWWWWWWASEKFRIQKIKILAVLKAVKPIALTVVDSLVGVVVDI